MSFFVSLSNAESMHHDIHKHDGVAFSRFCQLIPTCWYPFFPAMGNFKKVPFINYLYGFVITNYSQNSNDLYEEDPEAIVNFFKDVLDDNQEYKNSPDPKTQLADFLELIVTRASDYITARSSTYQFFDDCKLAPWAMMISNIVSRLRTSEKAYPPSQPSEDVVKKVTPASNSLSLVLPF